MRSTTTKGAPNNKGSPSTAPQSPTLVEQSRAEGVTCLVRWWCIDTGGCEDGPVVDILIRLEFNLRVIGIFLNGISDLLSHTLIQSVVSLSVFPVPPVGLCNRAYKHTPHTFISVIKHCKSAQMDQGISQLRGDIKPFLCGNFLLCYQCFHEGPYHIEQSNWLGSTAQGYPLHSSALMMCDGKMHRMFSATSKTALVKKKIWWYVFEMYCLIYSVLFATIIVRVRNEMRSRVIFL